MSDEFAEVVELEQQLEQVARVAAIDIAKASAMVCTRLPAVSDPGRRVQRTWAVKATLDAVDELADHLVGQGVQLVVMESTSNFWRPFFYVLEGRGLRVRLVNARDVKNVPGRPKTDKLDAIWPAKPAERGMLRASFVPPEPVRALRDPVRLRTTLVADRSRYRNRVQDVPQDACIEVSDKTDGASDLFGVLRPLDARPPGGRGTQPPGAGRAGPRPDARQDPDLDRRSDRAVHRPPRLPDRDAAVPTRHPDRTHRPAHRNDRERDRRS